MTTDTQQDPCDHDGRGVGMFPEARDRADSQHSREVGGGHLGRIQDCQTPQSGVSNLKDLRESFLLFQAACSGQRGQGKQVPASPVSILPECRLPPTVLAQGKPEGPEGDRWVTLVEAGATPSGHHRPPAALPGTLALPQTPWPLPVPGTR